MHRTRASLLLRIRDRQDVAAWGEFDAIYRPLLYRYARTRGLDDAEAEDIVQQCMGAIHARIDDFDYDPQKGRFKGWLCTVASNRIRNLYRGRREQPAESKDLKRDQQRERAPEAEFDRIWRDEHLRHCLRQVREEVQPEVYAAFERYVMREQSAEEVCAALDVTSDQLYRIKWRITQKIGDKMRALLGDDY